MKKLLTLLILVSFSGFVAVAQKKDKAPDEKKEKLKDELGVSKEVAAKIKAVKTDYKAKEKTVEADASLDKKAMKTKKKALKEEREQKILALLTPEQKSKYLALKERDKAQKKEADDK